MHLLPLLHFNDVYRVSKQKLQSGETIDVTQFAQLIDDVRAGWPSTGGLLLFSGDLFNPSVESSVVCTNFHDGCFMIDLLRRLGIVE